MRARWTPPAPGDIVWCRFPNLPQRSTGPKPRPALVCDVTEREDGVAVTVAYGTSQSLNRLRKAVHDHETGQRGGLAADGGGEPDGHKRRRKSL